MNFGTRDICSFFLGVALFCACGAAPGFLQEFILQLKDQKLNSTTAQRDQPLSVCSTKTCVVYFLEDVTKIKKYVVELEEKVRSLEAQLKDCQRQK